MLLHVITCLFYKFYQSTTVLTNFDRIELFTAMLSKSFVIVNLEESILIKIIENFTKQDIS